MISVLDKGFVSLVSSMGNDSSVVNAARVSLNNDSTEPDITRDRKLIDYLLRNGHTSPFEHVVFTFHVKCPMFVRSQWMRHRTWSFNEVSRRYTSEDIDFYIPSELRRQAESNLQASTDEIITEIISGETVSQSLSSITYGAVEYYHLLLDIGVAREQARMVLPQNMYTRFYATVDLHNLLHFIKLRDSEHAQFEMREYASSVRKLITEIVPITMDVWSLINYENHKSSYD